MRINESHETGRCEECGEMTYSDDPGRLMKDKHGNEKWVCQYCYDQLTPKKGKYDYVNVYTYENGKREYGKIGRQPYTNWFEVDVKDCPFKTKARVAKFAVDKYRKEHTKTNLWGNTWVEGGKPVAVKFYENGRFGKDFFRIRESFEKRGRMLKEDEEQRIPPQLARQAIQDWENLNKNVLGKSMEYVRKIDPGCCYPEENLADVNYGAVGGCTVYFNEDNSEAISVSDSFEVWDDSETIMYGVFTVDELKQLAESQSLHGRMLKESEDISHISVMAMWTGKVIAYENVLKLLDENYEGEDLYNKVKQLADKARSVVEE